MVLKLCLLRMHGRSPRKRGSSILGKSHKREKYMPPSQERVKRLRHGRIFVIPHGYSTQEMPKAYLSYLPIRTIEYKSHFHLGFPYQD